MVLLNGMAELKHFLLTDGSACLGCSRDVDFDLQRAWSNLLLDMSMFRKLTWDHGIKSKMLEIFESHESYRLPEPKL